MASNTTEKRKIAMAIGAIGLAFMAIGGTWMMSRAQTAAQDVASLKAQRGGRFGGFGGGPGGPGRGGPGRMMERMTEELGLTADQKTKLEAIRAEMRPPRPDQGGNNNMTREQWREQMQKSRAEMDAKIKEILTPEQQTKFVAMREQMRNRRGGPRGFGGPGGPDGAGGPGGMRGLGGPPPDGGFGSPPMEAEPEK